MRRFTAAKLTQAQRIYEITKNPERCISIPEEDFIVIDFFPEVMEVLACAQTHPTRRIEDILPEQPNKIGWDQDFDADDPKAVEAMLAKYNAVVAQETEEGITKDVWYVIHGKGSMDCGSPNTPEPIAKAAGALFIFLWYEKNIQCDLARDLARSYWDMRIGRTL
jgi:hypothetical protein